MAKTPPTRARLVIVGNGMAGARLVDEVRRAAPSRYDVVVIGAEPWPAYNRILLSSVLAGEKTLADIALGNGTDAAVHVGEAVEGIDRAHRTIRTTTGRSVAYDALVLATGSKPIVLPVPGADLAGVVTFRDIADVERMIAAAVAGRRAVVIGGGLLGLEAAEGLRRRGMAVTVVHLMPWLMERQLDAPAAGLLKASLERRGIKFILEADTAEITGGVRVTGVRLKDGRRLAADLVVMAAGIRPNADLARAAGRRGHRGVIVDDAMRTSDPAIYAVGECVEHRGVSYGLVAPLWEQVAVCARRLAGDATAPYEGSTAATSLKVTGIEMYSAGDLAPSEGAEEIVLQDPGRGVYRKLAVRDGRLVGAVLFGDAADGAWYSDLIRAGTPIAERRRELIFGRRFAETVPLAA
jgi:nitrite reductase (NADH) large subunit